jgi:hypothetical protein
MLAALLFAATATAQYTTYIRIPSGPPDGSADYDYEASVVAVEGGKTTLVMAVNYNDEDGIVYSGMSETITFDGSTWMETSFTTSMAEDNDYAYSFGCSMPVNTRSDVACTYSQNGPYIVSQYCEEYSSYAVGTTETYLYTYTSDLSGPESVETIIETYDGILSDIPDYCTEGASTLPESVAVQTVEMSGTDARYVSVVVTAGQDKLGATAGATPSNTGARPTGTTATGLETVFTQSGQSGSPTGPTDAPAAPENTNAALPMVTIAPALAGLGVAMAALVL